ncbi:low molecular weight phosphatase family protein [Gloeocapsa sp. PCC 73106]|uniref:arsenate-mycothiol transferase ArsC n=1 Tax=Gloeocapsa sp. PCC 73106 TaxID=102232 RepID=UPI0002AC0CEF|nr:low molecular weight phosphatase family protein [Gloeocapsa sp. PCC 73106]ELR96919.1 protein-tyrosine-phosphatase [Gloeocapsa sp. PCC 73106]
MKKVLFLCTGNYYRSRFSEYLFNHLAQGKPYLADSRGLNVNPDSGNVGAMSPEVIKELQELGINPDSDSMREPMQVQETDLAEVDRIIAVDDIAHRPMVAAKFPEWVDRVEYWRVKDLDENPEEPPLEQLAHHIEELLLDLDQDH